MNNRAILDLLDDHSRALPAAGPDADWLARLPHVALALATLLALAREIAGLLVPTCPRAAFRAELHQGLVASARQRQAQQALALSPRSRSPVTDLSAYAAQWLGESAGRHWVWSAAAVGSAASLIAILAYVLRHRKVTAFGNRPAQVLHG
jgi:hypothetical protein